MSLTQLPTSMYSFDSGSLAFRNRIINGDMRIDQRNAGASVASAAGVTFSVDRWWFCRAGGATGMSAQRVSGPTGYQYAMRLQRNTGDSSTAALLSFHIIESTNMFDLAGQTISVSFTAKAGANFSAASSILYCHVVTSTSADQTSASYYTGTATGLVTQEVPFTITTTGTRYSASVTLPANAASVLVKFFYGPTGTAGAADYVDITGVQLEKGTTATPFEFRPYGAELALCQRYYENGTFSSTSYGASTAGVTIPYKVTKRAAPSSITSTNEYFSGTSGLVKSIVDGNRFEASWSISTLGTYSVGFAWYATSEL